MVKRAVHWMGRKYIEAVCRSEFEGQEMKRWNERPVEFRFVFEQLAALSGVARTVLDVGTGTTALPHLIRNCGFVVTATDNVRDYWDEGMVNRHWHVLDDDITQTRLKEASFDVVTCVSVLEHIKAHGRAMESMLRVLKPGGRLLLTCPYHETEYCEDVYLLPGSVIGRGMPYVCQSFSRVQLEEWLKAGGARVLAQEYWQCWTDKLWSCGRQVAPAVRSDASGPHQLTCLAISKP